MTIEVKVDAEEITKALDQLDSKASAKAVKAAIRKGINTLKKPVRAEAPVGPTGNLRKKVGTRVRKSKKHAGFYGVVRSFAPHHHLVVSGTKDRFTRNGAFRGRMPGDDYVGRAADAHGEAALDVAEAELVRQLDLD